MKKWLMLAFLPFLLLVQQEAGATPSYVSTWNGGTEGYAYEMRFYNFTDSSFDYLLTFNPSNVDLHAIPPPTYGGTTGACNLPCGPIGDESLIQAWIIHSGQFAVPFVDLAVNDSSGEAMVTGNNSPDQLSRSVTAFLDINGNPIAGGTINGTYYCTPDGSGNCPPYFSNSDLLLTPNYNTCIQTQGMDNCSPSARITEATVPNSFMLLGIGLMVLGIPLRRGKLS